MSIPSPSPAATPPPPTTRLAGWMIARRRGLAWLGALILVIAWPSSSRLEMDRTIDQMFADDDPTLVAYEELRESFGGNAVVMLVYRDETLFTPAGLERAEEISRQVAAVPGVRGTLSVAELNGILGYLRPSGGLFGGRGSSDVPPLLRGRDAIARAFDTLFAGYTHSEDRRLGSVVALLDVADDERGFADAVQGLVQVTRALPPEATEAVLVGEPVLLEQGFDLIQRDGRRLAWLTVALLSPCVLMLIRSLRFVILQAIVILWAVTLTRAILQWLDFELSLVSSILTAIVTVITVTAVIHLGSSQRVLRKRGYDSKPAAARSMAWLIPPIFWACVTDAAGFLSLTVSGVTPVREFGWMMAIASLAVFAAMVLFAPLVITGGSTRFAELEAYSRLFDPKLMQRRGRQVRKGSLRLASVLVRYRSATIAVALGLAGLTLAGVSRLEIESSFLRNFREDSRLVSAYQMVESELSGAGVWDVVLDAPEVLTSKYLNQVRELQRELRAIDVDGERLTKVLSLADADEIAARVPLLRFASPTLRLAGMRTAIPAFSDALLVPAGRGDQDDSDNENSPGPAGDQEREPARADGSDGPNGSSNAGGSNGSGGSGGPNGADGADGAGGADARKLRIMLRSREHLPTETKIALIEEVERVVAEQTTSPDWRAAFAETETETEGRPGRVTGYYVLLARVVSQLISDQWRCLGVSAALVWLLLCFATRSPRLALIALIPNVLPVLGVLAALGLSGIKMNMGAAMIAAVSIGLSIDGSVHFMANYRRKVARGRSPYHAVLFAQKQIGLPLLMATLALVVGFSVLSISEFIPTATFGVLTAAALVAGTVTNLTLLPALLGSPRETVARPSEATGEAT